MGKIKTIKRIVTGTFFVAALGYVAGLLTAPKSGKETREDIRKTAVKSMADAEKQLKSLQEDLEDLIDDMKDRKGDLSDRARDELDDAIDKSNKVRGKAHELLSAMKDGEVDDKELKNAISDATNAIDHLRKYLKK